MGQEISGRFDNLAGFVPSTEKRGTNRFEAPPGNQGLGRVLGASFYEGVASAERQTRVETPQTILQSALCGTLALQIEAVRWTIPPEQSTEITGFLSMACDSLRNAWDMSRGIGNPNETPRTRRLNENALRQAGKDAVGALVEVQRLLSSDALSAVPGRESLRSGIGLVLKEIRKIDDLPKPEQPSAPALT